MASCNATAPRPADSDSNTDVASTGTGLSIPPGKLRPIPTSPPQTPLPLAAHPPPSQRPTRPPPGVSAVPPPPNGGLTAWLQVLGAFFLMFNTWGLSNTYGIFQSEYSLTILSGESESAISWIGSLQAFLMLLVCVLCGRLLDAGYFYLDISLGIFLEIFGMMMTSVATKYWHVILAQGVAVGVGAGMVFIPALQIVGTYFSTRRSTAMGIAATGSGVGGIVYPVLLKRLIASIGFRWAVRVMAFVMLATLLVSVAVMKPRRLPVPTKPKALFSLGAFRDAAFATWLAAIFMVYVGLYIPFFYVEKYALDIGVSDDLAFYMLIIINVASLPGRVVPSYLADKLGNLSIMVPSVLVAGVSILAWIAADTQEGLITVAFFLGLASGAIQAVVPGTVVFLCPDLSMLGTNLGMTLAASGFGLLIGSPVAGVLLDTQLSTAGHSVYWGSFVFAGAAVLVGCVLMICVRVIKVGFAIKKA
ncbi:hypothetical protein OQA88_10826 [Cercophora sp. LCS_1]